MTHDEWDALYGRTADAMAEVRYVESRLASDPHNARLQRTVRRRLLVLDALRDQLDDAYHEPLEES